MDVREQHAPVTVEDQSTEHARPARRLPRSVQLLVLLIAAGGLAAWLLLGSLFSKHAEEAAAPAATSSTSFTPTAEQWAGFKTAVIKLASFAPTQTTDGTIALDDDLTTQVFSPFSGRVTKLFAKAGDVVKAGDPLLAMQASEFVQAYNDLVAAVGTYRADRAQLALASTTEKRQHDLYLAQGGALKDWQQSQSDLATAQSTFSSAQVAIGAVRNRLRILGKSDSEITDMETSNDPSRFSPEATLFAPIAGTITQRQVGLGQNIVNQAAGGSTPVFTIGDLSRVWLVANAREADAAQIHIGDPVQVTVLGFPGRVFDAKISFVGAAIDSTTHRLPIHAVIENPDHALKPQMFANFRIVTGQAQQAPSIPAQAIVYDPDGAHVWVEGSDKTLSIHPVKLGRSDGSSVEVLDGVKAGDVVVTSGSVFIDRAAEAD